MSNLKKSSLVLLLFLFLLLADYQKLYAQEIQEKGFPIPKGDSNQLFYLQRTENTNTVIYELNYQNGILDSKNPIHPFWILYADKNQKEELNELEKKFVYGIEVNSFDNDVYELKLKAYPKIPMKLMKDDNRQYHVYVDISGKQILLHRIYVKIKEGGSTFRPNVEYIELSGIETENDKIITERILP